MDFSYTPEEERFRSEVVQFIAENLTPEVVQDREHHGTSFINTPARKEFVSRMARKGWLTLSWPEEWGGQNKGMYQYILNDELLRAGAPIVGKNLGIIANVIMHHGSEALKKEFIPRILRNEVQWALCYTEPEAGSDLASLQMRATRDGDEFVLSGQKRFITSADFADYLWVAARTDTNLPKHKGISLFIVDVKSPGITITPMYCMNGERTNEVFFDNTHVPAQHLVGELNHGWYYISEALDYERFALISFTPVRRRFERLVEWARTARLNGGLVKDDPVARRMIARLAVRVTAGHMLNLRVIARAAEPNYVPNVEAAMNRAWVALVGPEIDDLALELAGPYGYLWESGEAPDGGEFCKQWTMGPHSRTAAAGLDVSKNIIAKRGLKLPS